MSNPKLRHLQEKRNRFTYSVINFLTLLVLILMSVFIAKDSQDYYTVQNGLFVGCLVTTVGCFAIARIDRSIFDSLRLLKNHPRALGFVELSNLMWIANFVLGLLGILVVDMSFFAAKGFRIGTVVAISLLRILWTFTKK